MARWWIIAVGLVVALPGRVAAGPSLEDMLSMGGEDAILLDTSWDVIRARILGVAGGSTKGDPPQLELEVQEVLRGGLRIDRRRAIWEPFPHDIDWLDGSTEERIARWEAETLGGPPRGTSWILVGPTVHDSLGTIFLVSALGRFPSDPERDAWTRAALARAPVLRAEAAEYAAAWRRPIGEAELLDGARPVLAETPLSPGDPVLILWATLWQGRVVRTSSDGSVVVRPEGHDSRWDSRVLRETLRLYPERLLSEDQARPGATAPPISGPSAK